MKLEKQRITPLLFTVYLAAASGRSSALPCLAAFLVLSRFVVGIPIYTVYFSDPGNRVFLKNMRFLLLTGNDNLSPRQSNQLKLLLNEYPQFNVPYQLKEAFRDIYLYCTTREEAEQAYNEWINTCHDSNCTAYDSFINMVENWHTEIFNYFDYRYTNAQTESLNNVIRETDRAGRGYTFEILRAKMLFRGSIAKKGKFNYKGD